MSTALESHCERRGTRPEYVPCPQLPFDTVIASASAAVARLENEKACSAALQVPGVALPMR